MIYALTDSTPKEADRCWHNNTLDPRSPFKSGVVVNLYDKVQNTTQTLKRERMIKGSKDRVQISTVPGESPFESGTNLGLIQFCLFCDQLNAFWMFETPANLYAQINKMLDIERYAQLSAELNKNLEKEDRLQKQFGVAKAELQELYTGRQQALSAQASGKQTKEALAEVQKKFKPVFQAFQEFVAVSGDYVKDFENDSSCEQQIRDCEG